MENNKKWIKENSAVIIIPIVFIDLILLIAKSFGLW